jgi:hypothetical protein
MTKRCKDLARKYFEEIKCDATYCLAVKEGRILDCPKNRLQGQIGQSCWQRPSDEFTLP